MLEKDSVNSWQEVSILFTYILLELEFLGMFSVKYIIEFSSVERLGRVLVKINNHKNLQNTEFYYCSFEFL